MHDFTTAITERLLPSIKDIFRRFVATSVFFPTEHLYVELQRNPRQLELLENGFNTTYRIAHLNSDYHLLFIVNRNSFSVIVAPSDSIDNTPTTTNLSVSPNRQLNMYMYGVKANGHGPKISGNALNSAAMMICHEMRIPELYISDAAGVACYWNEQIELHHFSILRVIAGKPTFYESMPGHFLDADKAREEKQRLSNSISSEDKAFVNRYLESLAKKHLPLLGDSCGAINTIIQKGLSLLGSHPAIFKYVATPYKSRMKKTKKNKGKSPIKSRRRR